MIRRTPERALWRAIVSCLVVPAGVAFATAASFSMAPHALAATPQVAVVVQAGPTAPPQSRCVAYHPGMSGYDLLREAGHQVQDDGTSVRIDGLPEAGEPNGASHWQYLYRTSGQDWTEYQQSGAQSLPQPGTVEAWLKVGGAAYAAPDLGFAAICGGTSKRVATTQPGHRPMPLAWVVIVGLAFAAVLAGGAMVRENRIVQKAEREP